MMINSSLDEYSTLRISCIISLIVRIPIRKEIPTTKYRDLATSKSIKQTIVRKLDIMRTYFLP